MSADSTSFSIAAKSISGGPKVGVDIRFALGYWGVLQVSYRIFRRRALAGIVLFAAALALRIWGLSFGLPSFFSGDEVEKRDDALQLAQAGFAHDARQPSFIYNSLFLIYSAAKLVRSDWTIVDYHYMGRLWMALLGALTVVIVWLLGSRLEENKNQAGPVSALLLAILPLHTATSRYIKEDAPFGLMVTSTVLASIIYLKHPSPMRLLLVGLFAGLTFSTKYTGLVLIAPILLAFLVCARRRRRGLRAGVFDLAALGAAFGIGFFIFSPIALFHPGDFVDGFLFQRRYAMSGHDGIAIDPWSEWWTYYIRNGLVPGMTWPVFLLSVAGLGLLARARNGWLIVITAVWLYVVLEHGRAKPAPFPARYLMPLAPLLCVAAGLALVRLASALKKRLSATAVYAVCGALFVAPPLVKSLLIADEAVHDTRISAGKWMEENIPPGSRIVITEGEGNLPVSNFWGTRWRVERRGKNKGLDASWSGRPPPYFVITSFQFQRYLESPRSLPARTEFYSKVMKDFELIKEFGPRWLTYGKHSPVILIYRPRIRPELSTD